MTDIADYNRRAWDQLVKNGNRWTVPVSDQQIADARNGQWQVVLTPQKPVPADWFPELNGIDLLGLASGGGQQGPILAAAGASVVIFDNSPNQLQQDQSVAEKHGLRIATVRGDMRDLSCFASESFDLVFNPCSVCFVPDLQPVFDEIYRVLRVGGRLMCGFTNPARFVFDELKLESGEIVARHTLPYSDETHLSQDELDKLIADNEPLMFSHSLESIIAGQARAGFTLRDLFEDRSEDELAKLMPDYFATLATK